MGFYKTLYTEAQEQLAKESKREFGQDFTHDDVVERVEQMKRSFDEYIDECEEREMCVWTKIARALGL